MIRALYVEDIPDEIEHFLRLIRVAGDARRIHIEIDAVHMLSQIGPAPLYDLLLLDLSLSNGGRAATVDWIARNSARMPCIVVLTGYTPDEEDCIRYGAEDFILKPDAVTSPEVFVERLKIDVLRHRLRRGQ